MLCVLFQQLCNLLLDHRAFEKIGVSSCPEVCRVHKRERTKIIRAHDAIFDQFVRFLHNLVHVRNVEVADVGAEQRVDFRTQRICAIVESP